MYLIYTTEQDAIERADEEGKYNGFAYWTEGKGTRWLTNQFLLLTASGHWMYPSTSWTTLKNYLLLTAT